MDQPENACAPAAGRASCLIVPLASAADAHALVGDHASPRVDDGLVFDPAARRYAGPHIRAAVAGPGSNRARDRPARCWRRSRRRWPRPAPRPRRRRCPGRSSLRRWLRLSRRQAARRRHARSSACSSPPAAGRRARQIRSRTSSHVESSRAAGQTRTRRARIDHAAIYMAIFGEKGAAPRPPPAYLGKSVKRCLRPGALSRRLRLPGTSLSRMPGTPLCRARWLSSPRERDEREDIPCSRKS